MTSEANQFNSEYRVVIEIPVQWGDMDALAHVNNVVYLRWFESARIAYFEQVSFMSRMQAEKIGPILASSEIKYRLPVEFPDSVLVGVNVIALRESDLIQQYAVFSRTKNTIVTTGQSRIVMYDFNNRRKAEIPFDIAQKIKMLEGI